MTFRSGNLPGYQGQLRTDTPTIAEVLKQAVYQTAMSGKWHVSRTVMGPEHLKYLNNQRILKSFADLDSYPMSRGFEHYFGIIWGVANYFDPFSLVEGTNAVPSVPKDFYLTDAIADHAIQDLEGFKQSDQPFFLYVAFTAPHWPLHARPEELAKYRETYEVGWDAIREAPYQRQVTMGLFKPDNAVVDATRGPRTHLDGRETQGLASVPDDRSRGDGGPVGPGRGTHPTDLARRRPIGQHADLLPLRQRRQSGRTGRRGL